MNPVRRMLPARENLRRVHGESAREIDVAGVDMMLHLINVVDIIRSTVYESLRRSMGLTEGKFTLMMVLRDAEGPLGVSELSERLGVAPATISVMVARMLQAEEPLVLRTSSEKDARAKFVELSDAGRRLLDRALPEHFERIAEFSSAFSGEEREQLIALLKKLAPSDAGEVR